VNSLTQLGRDGVDYIWLKIIDGIGLSPQRDYEVFPDMVSMLTYAGIIYEDEEE